EEREELTLIPPDRGRGMGTIVKILVLTLFTLLVVGGGYLWWFPTARYQALEWASPWLRSIPGMEQLLGTEVPEEQKVTQPAVGLKDIRLRSITNSLAGNFRVLEGTVVNQSSDPLAKISVRLELSDADAVVLSEQTVICGNLLTDVELSTLAESEIQQELSLTEGRDTSNDRIPPGGEIPFMIAFGMEPPEGGAIKVVVMPDGAEGEIPFMIALDQEQTETGDIKVVVMPDGADKAQ
ncbi:MAG: DUF3426 domain-containing protein, partial [Syntrophaceae bacterium]|nr:DUF3426 domain-containing protein [Syntrophaceae bacterium]